MTVEQKVIKRFKSFRLGFCQCGCGTELPSLISKKRSRDKHGWLRKYLNSAHSLKGKNQSGENNPRFKTGRIIDKDGYVKLIAPSDHPFKDAKNRVYEHRLVYENYLSIILDEQVYLNPDEEIHHINGIKDDNRLINLQYMATRKDHKKEHLKKYDGVTCKICGSSKTGIRKDDGQPRWMGNEIDGYSCESCSKKEYYIKNKERINKYREDNRENILKQQKEYNKTRKKRK